MTSKDLLDLLMPREFQIVMAVKLGHCNKQIADNLGLSQNTVRKYYLSNIYRKLNIKGTSKLKRLELIKLMNEVTGSFIHV